MSAFDDSLAALTAKVSAQTTVIRSATTLIGGIKTMIATAVQAAFAAGATPAQLAAVQAVSDALDADGATDLAAATVANTPAA